MEYSAITHYMERRYCYSIGDGRFVIRIETKKDDIEKIVLHHKDKYIPVQFLNTWDAKEMVKVASDRYTDYYEVVIDIDCVCLRYQFEIIDKQGLTTYYGNYEFYDNKIDNNDYMFDLPQNLREEERMEIPEWANNKVVYQIFPSRYATTENVSEKKWYKHPIKPMDDLRGNLKGIINSLDHLEELGVDVIYMTPIFMSDSMHKYDTIDYYKIDPNFGTEDDLKELVEKAHAKNIKIILDGVFNHSSVKFFAFDDIMKNQNNSKYLDWYYIDSLPLDFGSMRSKPNFKCFAYHGYMPKLNLSNEETANYFINVGKYWIEKCDIDGWRLDVGDEVIHSFWKKFRHAIKEAKKDALIIGEIWHYAGDFLEGDEWDTVMNYNFFNTVRDFVATETITASHFLDRLGFTRGRLYRHLNPVLFNLIDSHDTARFAHMADNNTDKSKLAAAMQLLLPGMPMIYYGDEYGMTGGHDPDCRRGMLWDEKYQNPDIYNWYRNLIKVRRTYPALTEGEVIACEACDENGIVKISRQLDDRVMTVIFHGKENSVELDEYKGYTDILTGKIFDGSLKGYGVLVVTSSINN